MFLFNDLSSKVILIALIAVSSLALYTQGNVIKDAANEVAYAAMEIALKNEYPNQPEMQQCMIDDFRRNHVADKIWTSDLVFNTDKLQRELKPYRDEAHVKCKLIVFFQSTPGIFALVGLFCLALIIICCLIRCVCC